MCPIAVDHVKPWIFMLACVRSEPRIRVFGITYYYRRAVFCLRCPSLLVGSEVTKLGTKSSWSLLEEKPKTPFVFPKHNLLNMIKVSHQRVYISLFTRYNASAPEAASPSINVGVILLGLVL